MIILHDRLIKLLQLLKYQKEDRGVCLGFTIKWLEAMLLQDIKTFEHRMERLLRMDTLAYIPEIMNKTAYDDLNLLDMLAFLDNVMLYQNSYNYRELFSYASANLEDIEYISSFAASDNIQKCGGLMTILYVPAVFYSGDDVAAYLGEFRKNILSAELPSMTIGILLIVHRSVFNGHAIGLSYRTNSDRWSMMDINNWPENKNQSIQDIASKISCMYIKNSYHVANIIIITTQKQAKLFSVFEKKILKSAASERERSITTVKIQATHALLYLASRYGYTNIISELQIGLHIVARPGHLWSDHLWGGHFEKSLRMAARYGHSAIIANFARYSVGLNQIQSDGMNLAYIAAEYGHPSVIAELAKHAVDLREVRSNRETLVYVAAQYAHPSVITELVKHGADLNQARDDGIAPLEIAAHYGYVSVIIELVKHGVDLNKSLPTGPTPAFIAARQGHASIIAVLAKHGVDLNKAQSNGGTPAFIAAQRGHFNVIELLLDYSADFNNPFMTTVLSLRTFAEGHSPIIKDKIEKFIAYAERKDTLYIYPEQIAYIMGHKKIVQRLWGDKIMPCTLKYCFRIMGSKPSDGYDVDIEYVYFFKTYIFFSTSTYRFYKKGRCVRDGY